MLGRVIQKNGDYEKLWNSSFYVFICDVYLFTIPKTKATYLKKHIVDTLKKRNWHVEFDTFQDNTPYGVKTFTNIIATYKPSAPKKLVLAAHYDSKNLTDRRYPNKQFIGATDSAVPCAILLDLAVQLDCLFQKGLGNKASDITPQLVFFDGEEAFKDWTATDSIYGARHLAEKWSQPDPLDNSRTVLQSIKAFVLLDLIGTDDIHFLNFFTKTSDLFEELVKIAYPQGGGIEDDHIPFLRKGVPILHLISAPFPSVWHKMSDNGDAINYQVTENFNRIFRVFVASYLHLDALLGSCRRKKK
ncbi:hypothetical protein KUTeg_013814 [Tegillarca granosa]|uniref:glutaminyl-peptide cyclotransferase n=1 Tax=Tegillarca granosa TaxID=220873 RepID=A0ABQ9EZX1_TEGGR|nr:hypothetical protein KUTeg_013814 [Tegillarca granosa]